MGLSQRIENDICIVSITGELNITQAKEVRLYVNTLLDGKKFRALIMNLKEITAIDSTGLGVILLTYGRLTKNNIQFVICQPDRNVSRIFNDVYVNRIIPIFNTEEDALAGLRIGGST
ncbi:MAG: anti-sigma factor antagonist [SAR324 cluster bacterium]|nr:anti-sigma factor antagonist [SAR324 cluster bacterium]